MTDSRAPKSAFLFVIAQHASASLLKAELAREHPELRLAYSRPGVYTFKSPHALGPDFRLGSVFARHSGLSLGSADSPTEIGALLARAPAGSLRLHVFEREAPLRDSRASTPPLRASSSEVRSAILRAHPDRFYDDERSVDGDWVLDVIVPPPGSTEREKWLIGVHRHGPGSSSRPGGVPRLDPPEHAPSRSWSKLEELVLWSGLELAYGHVAVEIGAAPGGAAVALLERGLDVIAIDPAAMDARVEGVARRVGRRFRHITLPAGAVHASDLPGEVDWLLCDANLAPQVALRYVERLVPRLRRRLRGVIVTLKLNDERIVAEIPALVERVGRLGLGEPRATQLPSHRREIVACVARSQKI